MINLLCERIGLCKPVIQDSIVFFFGRIILNTIRMYVFKAVDDHMSVGSEQSHLSLVIDLM